MKAHRLMRTGPRRLELAEFELPALSDDAILVQNELTAVSVGTEIFAWTHGSEPGGKPNHPRPTGYCSLGTVLEVGANVTQVKPGDRVAAEGCHASHEVTSRLYFRVPEGVAPDDAVFLVLAAVSMHGIRKARIELGESVAVLGLGIVGQLALTLARLSGATPIVALDMIPARLERALKRGADLAINPGAEGDAVERLRAACVDDGANVVLESTGKPAAYPLAAQLACRGGRMIALGTPRGSVDIDFNRDFHLREVSLIGAFQPMTPVIDHVYYHWTKDRDRKLLLRLMADGRLPAADLITHRANPADCQSVYEMLADRPHEALGVVFEWR